MSYDEFLYNYNLPNVFMKQFNGIISAISKFLKSVSGEKACIKNLLSFHTKVFWYCIVEWKMYKMYLSTFE